MTKKQEVINMVDFAPGMRTIIRDEEVESVFDIASLALARKPADDVPPEEKGRHREVKGPVKMCPFCGDAFI